MGSYRPGSDSRLPPRSHRARDRREESPRHRDDRREESRRYRDRRSPDTTRRNRHHDDDHHRRESNRDNYNNAKEEEEGGGGGGGGEEAKNPPRKRGYPKSSVERDNAAWSKFRSSVPRRPPKGTQSINELKTKIRDVKRLLGHAEGMPADRRVEKERELAGYQRDLEEAEEKKKRSEMISKYHFVRFLERKRATTNLNRALQHLNSLETAKTPSPTHASDLSAAKAQVHEARVSLNYTIYCPLNQKYISLYPADSRKGKNKGKGRDKDAEKESAESNEYLDSHPDSLMLRNKSGEKPPLWALVETCMLEDEEEEEGSRRRLEELRDGKIGVELAGEVGGEGGGSGGGGKGMSLPVVGGKKKPGTFGVGNGTMMVGGKKPGSFGVGNSSNNSGSKKKNDSKAGGDVEMKDDGEESDGGFFE